MGSDRLNTPAPFTPWPEPARYRRKLVNAQGQEMQHRLLRADAVTLTTMQVARLTEDQAFEKFCHIRYFDTEGKPECPHCESTTKIYLIKTRRIFKCGVCLKQFSPTAGTSFNSRKRPYGEILSAALVFANGVSGVAALRIRREVGWSYKTGLIFGHKARLAMGTSRSPRQLTGEVEIDGCAYPQKVRKPNMRNDVQTDGRRTKARATQQMVVAARERGEFGESRLTVVVGEEVKGIPFLMDTIDGKAKVISDNGNWTDINYVVAGHDVVNHTRGYKINGVSSNQAESLFARLRRGERGVYHHTRGKNLDLYAQETSWREDHRHLSNGDQWARLLYAMTHTPKSARFNGYWQRWTLDGVKRRKRGKRVGWRVGYGVNLPVERGGEAPATIAAEGRVLGSRDPSPRLAS